MTLQQNLKVRICLSALGDVRLGKDVQISIEKTIETFGDINAIHNNAGIASPSKPIDETSEDEWDILFSVNLKSVFWTTKFGINSLKKTKGCILNTSSMVGEMGQDNHAAYVATKGGMNGLTKAMALDYAPFGIRVNAVCPAGVWTPMLRKWAGEQTGSCRDRKLSGQYSCTGFLSGRRCHRRRSTVSDFGCGAVCNRLYYAGKRWC